MGLGGAVGEHVFGEALARERGAGPADLEIEVTNLDVRPYPYQQEILAELAAEREVHNNWHNLVVMATGTVELPADYAL